jgi:glutamyl-tRNA synthetase
VLDPLTLEGNAELKEITRKIALLNAIRHDGKAQAGPVIGKILGEKSEFRTKVKELSDFVSGIILEVNNLSLSEQQRIVEENWPELLEKER